VEGTDYKLNTEFGIFQVLEGATHVEEGDDIHYSVEQPELEITQIRVNRKASQQARLLYLADDANTLGKSAKDRLEVWRVNVAPDGDLNLISDEHGAFSLTMAIVDDSANHPNDPYGTLDRIE
jgi:hypothetical protein